MPKQLLKAPPTSSVARLLDVEAAARAVAVNPPRPTSEHSAAPITLIPNSSALTPKAVDNRPRIKRELVLTEKADATLTRLVELYRRHSGTKLTTSHVARAVLKGIAHCSDAIEREARRLGPLQLPANSPDCELERERFEARIADAFVAGIRNASSYDLNDDGVVGR